MLTLDPFWRLLTTDRTPYPTRSELRPELLTAFLDGAWSPHRANLILERDPWGGAGNVQLVLRADATSRRYWYFTLRPEEPLDDPHRARFACPSAVHRVRCAARAILDSASSTHLELERCVFSMHGATPATPLGFAPTARDHLDHADILLAAGYTGGDTPGNIMVSPSRRLETTQRGLCDAIGPSHARALSRQLRAVAETPAGPATLAWRCRDLTPPASRHDALDRRRRLAAVRRTGSRSSL